MALEAPTLGLVLNAVSSDSQENYGYEAYRYSAAADPPPAPFEESRKPAPSAKERSTAADESSESRVESAASADEPPVKTT
jgi:hypothetical protein